MNKTDSYENILKRFENNKDKLALYKTGLSKIIKNFDIEIDKNNNNKKSPQKINDLNILNEKIKQDKIIINEEKQQKNDKIMDNINSALFRLKEKYNFDPNIVPLTQLYLKDDKIDTKILSNRNSSPDEIIKRIKTK